MKSKELPKRLDRLSGQLKGRHNHHATKVVVSNTNNYVFAGALIDAIHEPIIILDKELTIQAANSALFQTFKVTPQGTMQRNIADLGIKNSQMRKLTNRLQKLATTETSFKEFELTYKFTKVGERIMRINAKRIIFDQKQSDFLLLSIEDITQRKIIEQQKDDFVGYVTHELKTPLTSLAAFVQILQGYHEKTRDKKSQFLLAKVAGQIERLTKLLSSFNHVYKAQNGMLELKNTPFSLTDLVKETVETFQYTTSTHIITIEGTVTSLIKADKERIRQVIVNLLINAIKYSPTADVIIVKLDENPQEVTISVQDFGIGIPKSQQDHIFERFFRVKAKEKYNIKGLGLGLYITREIIKAHGGKLAVESVEGKGSTFSFSLPVK
ncbi:MAG: ATP-binding protein [Candidatus Levyibacteriota bacterium]